jgi:hypothetical protein
MGILDGFDISIDHTIVGKQPHCRVKIFWQIIDINKEQEWA